MHFCPRFLNATLVPLLLKSAFRRAFCSFRGISDMHSMIQIFNAAQYISLFTNEEIEFHSICITCQDNTAHRGTRNELVFFPLIDLADLLFIAFPEMFAGSVPFNSASKMWL